MTTDDSTHTQPGLTRLEPMIGGAVQAWPPGLEVLHVYALPQITPEFAAFLATCRTVDPALIAPIEDQWLHMTVLKAPDLSPGDPEVKALAAALEETLPSEPVVIEFAAALARCAIMLTAPADDAAAGLVSRAATDAARKAGVQVKQPKVPHISAGYCTSAVTDLPPAQVAALDYQIGVRRLKVPIAAVELVWVTQDPKGPTYTWRTHTPQD